jgi:hypothetical protein
MRRIIKALGIVLVAVLMIEGALAEGARKRVREKEPPPPPPDKRDRLVNAPGMPFHGRPYWQALAQCGGIYFKLNTLYSNAAIQARVVKPDAAANVRFSKLSDAARRTATAFFEAAERFLISDRGLAREQAVLIYDGKANEEGERQKTAEAGEQAAKPCPALYHACRDAFAKVCSEPAVSASLTMRNRPRAGLMEWKFSKSRSSSASERYRDNNAVGRAAGAELGGQRPGETDRDNHQSQADQVALHVHRASPGAMA